MSEDLDQKAGRYLAEGRVAALLVNLDKGFGVFLVSGSGDEPYKVVHRDRAWECNCQARVLNCAHIRACKLITRNFQRRL